MLGRSRFRNSIVYLILYIYIYIERERERAEIISMYIQSSINEHHQQCSQSLVVNFGTIDFASRLGTDELLKQ